MGEINSLDCRERRRGDNADSQFNISQILNQLKDRSVYKYIYPILCSAQLASIIYISFSL